MSNIGENFSVVDIRYTSGEVTELEIVRSENFDQGLLAATYAKFKIDSDLSYLTHFLDIKKLYFNSMSLAEAIDISRTAMVSVMDSDDSIQACFYTNTNDAKIYVLDVINYPSVPKAAEKVIFKGPADRNHEIELTYKGRQYFNFLILLVDSSEDKPNFSESIHNFLEEPHSDFRHYIYTYHAFDELNSKKILDNNKLIQPDYKFNEVNQVDLETYNDPQITLIETSVYDITPTSERISKNIVINNFCYGIPYN